VDKGGGGRCALKVTQPIEFVPVHNAWFATREQRVPGCAIGSFNPQHPKGRGGEVYPAQAKAASAAQPKFTRWYYMKNSELLASRTEGVSPIPLERSEATPMRCKAITASGQPCKAKPHKDGLCFFHFDPAKAAELGRKRGAAPSAYLRAVERTRCTAGVKVARFRGRPLFPSADS
jgi:hypothetical protein